MEPKDFSQDENKIREERRKLNEIKKQAAQERQQQRAAIQTKKDSQETSMKKSSFFAILSGFFAGYGVFFWGSIVCLLLAKVLTGNYFDVWTRGFKPQPIFWIAFALLLALGSFSGGYIAARIDNRSRIIHALIVGILFLLPLVYLRETPWLYVLPLPCALLGAALVLPPQS